MSAMVGEWLSNLCLPGPFINSTNDDAAKLNSQPVDDDLNLLPDYGELYMLDVDAMAELQLALDSSEGISSFSHFDQSLSGAGASTSAQHNNLDVLNAINNTTSFLDIFDEPSEPSTSETKPPPSTSTSTSQTATSTSSAITGRGRRGRNDQETGHDKEAGSNSSPQGSRGRSAQSAAPSEDDKGEKVGRSGKTILDPQPALLYSTRMPSSHSLTSSFPVINTTNPRTILTPTAPFHTTLAFTTASLIPPMTSPVTFTPSTATPATPVTLQQTLASSYAPCSVMSTRPSYIPCSMVNHSMNYASHVGVNPNQRFKPSSIFAQTPTFSIMPMAVSHTSRTDVNCPKVYGAQSSTNYPRRGKTVSDSAYMAIEELRNQIRKQKAQRIKAASRDFFNRDGNDRMKQHKTVFSSYNPGSRSEASAHSSHCQQPPHNQKSQHQWRNSPERKIQRQSHQHQKDLLAERQDFQQQKLLRTQQQQLARLQRQHAKQLRELQEKQTRMQHINQRNHKRQRHHKKANLGSTDKSSRPFTISRQTDDQLTPRTPWKSPETFSSCRNKGSSVEDSCSDWNQDDGEMSDVELDDVLRSCSQPSLSTSSGSQRDQEPESADGLYHFDGYRMAPAQNDTFDFFMAETTCSDAQSDTEDSNLDCLLQQFKSPSYQEPQQCLSDVCNVSETAEGFDLMCDQSSSQLTIEDNVSRSVVASLPGACEMSPGHSSVFNVSQSPMSVSNASVAATAGTHCDLSWASVTDDESATEISSSSQKGEKRKASPGTSPNARRRAIPNYQTMTPWTNDNLAVRRSFPSPNREIPCFPLDGQTVREQSLNAQSPILSSSQLPDSCIHSTAVTETVYSLTTSSPSLSVQGYAEGQSLKRPHGQFSELPHVTREKRFRKTAEALQKCGLWDIAMKTGNLIKRNAELQKEIDRFRAEATVFLKAVVQNPENKELMKSLSRGVPLTLRQKARATNSFESDTVTTTTASTSNSKVSDCNSSTTSGYASYTEGRSKQSSPSQK